MQRPALGSAHASPRSGCAGRPRSVARNPKGLYGRAAAGLIRNLPGVDVSYDAPERPEAVVDTEHQTPDQAAAIVLASLPCVDGAAIPAT